MDRASRLGGKQHGEARLHILERRGRIYRDGPDFEDPAVSAFGCGGTPREAYDRWRERALMDRTWNDRRVPLFEEFALED